MNNSTAYRAEAQDILFWRKTVSGEAEMSAKTTIAEIEKAIDIFSEFRSKYENDGENSLVAFELIRLELKLHERARRLRKRSPKPEVKRGKEKNAGVGMNSEKESLAGEKAIADKPH